MNPDLWDPALFVSNLTECREGLSELEISTDIKYLDNAILEASNEGVLWFINIHGGHLISVDSQGLAHLSIHPHVQNWKGAWFVTIEEKNLIFRP